MNYTKPIVIAEIGCNHKGDLNLAKKLIKSAAQCGADYAKFQKRDNRYLLKDDYFKPHPNPMNSYGSNYGEHREFLEFNIKQHKILFLECLKNKIKYSVSVWEKKSAEDIVKSKLKLDYVKVPSACNLDFELLEYLALKFKKKIHLSLGMTTAEETNKIYNFFKKHKREKDLIFYSCTSSYPSEFKDICLLEISKLKKKYGNKVDKISFSGHHKGIAVDVAAYTLGAVFIERHFTLDRTWKGTDHAASLEPDGLNKLVRDLGTIHLALKFKNKILGAEKYQRKKLKRFIKN
jgi:N-acetylneuraminate synthase|tara:strand:- start:1331 stop:2203 length:873 start_codon:yes stop_codon:yes gene_type:complete